jgi:hypothetical protein
MKMKCPGPKGHCWVNVASDGNKKRCKYCGLTKFWSATGNVWVILKEPTKAMSAERKPWSDSSIHEEIVNKGLHLSVPVSAEKLSPCPCLFCGSNLVQNKSLKGSVWFCNSLRCPIYLVDISAEDWSRVKNTRAATERDWLIAELKWALGAIGEVEFRAKSLDHYKKTKQTLAKIEKEEK